MLKSRGVWRFSELGSFLCFLCELSRDFITGDYMNFRVKCKVREHCLHTRPLLFLTPNCKFRDSCKSSLKFDNLLDLKNSLKGVLLTITVYYRERCKIKVSQWKRHKGQRLGGLQTWNFHCPLCGGRDYSLGVIMWHYMWNIANKEAHLSFGVQSFYWGSITYIWVIDCPCGWF